MPRSILLLPTKQHFEPQNKMSTYPKTKSRSDEIIETLSFGLDGVIGFTVEQHDDQEVSPWNLLTYQRE